MAKMLLRKVGWLLALFLLLSPAAGESAAVGPRDLPEIIASGIIRVAMLKTDEKPFFYHDKTGDFTGLDVELLAMIAEELGVKAVLLRDAATFDGVIEMVASGRADLGMSYLSITSARAQKVFYTNPYALNHFAVVVNRVTEAQSRTRGDLGALLNHPRARIGVQKGSSYEQFARRIFPRASLVFIDDAAANITAVSVGEIDAAISARLSLLPILRDNPGFNYRLRAEIYHQEPDLMSPVVNPQSPHLLNWLNTFLQLLELQGTLDTIKARHGIIPGGQP